MHSGKKALNLEKTSKARNEVNYSSSNVYRIERMRDSLAGAVLGAIIFMITLIWTTLGSVYNPEAAFSSSSNITIFLRLTCYIVLGCGAGYAVGRHLTKDSVIKKSIKRWLAKNNRKDDVL